MFQKLNYLFTVHGLQDNNDHVSAPRGIFMTRIGALLVLLAASIVSWRFQLVEYHIQVISGSNGSSDDIS